jgi:cysteine-rich repeat protein
MTPQKATFMSLRTLPALRRRLALTAALAVGAFVLPPCGASAQVPAPLTMTYQGSLSDAGGRPVDGVRSIAFRLYDAREGGQVLWSEIHAEVDVAQGDFSVVLGEASELPGGVDPSQGLWLGIQVESDDELTPRMRVGGALRAHWAAVAAQALDVRDRHIHPNAVSIGDRPVIDAQGRWVGDPTGLQGPPGEAGATGQPGPEGVPGADGAPGPAGPAGGQGPSGPQGEPGSRGPAGEVGRSVELTQDSDFDGYEDWMEVAVGTDPANPLSVPPDAEADGVPDLLQPSGGPGAEGVPGPPGPPGPQGFGGPEGPVGPMGPAGPQGVGGPQGPIGPQGPEVDLVRDRDLDGFPDWLEIALGADPVDDADRPADLNDDGVADALVGPQGPAGLAGVAGPAGPQGQAGAQGPQGLPGAQGLPGPAGAQGLPGAAGAQGLPGAQGPAGAQGVQGLPGAQGPAGAQGVQGLPGAQGPAGPAGPAGARGPAGLNALLENAVEQPGAHCPAGGVRLDFGLDADANGRLEGGEIAGTRYVCNGGAAAGGGPVTLAAAPPFPCDATHVGATFYDTALGGLRACNGQVWAASGGYCGDAVLQPGEQCDDGNLLSGDGCLPHFCVRAAAANCALACDPTGTTSDSSLRTLKVSAADGAATDNLGFAVSIEGDLVAVGAPNDDGPGADSGAVFVFSRQGDGTWGQPQKLLASDGAASDFFGFSVSIGRTHLIVGAWGDDDRGANAGSAYAFTRQPNGTWTETAKLTSADGAAGRLLRVRRGPRR